MPLSQVVEGETSIMWKSFDYRVENAREIKIVPSTMAWLECIGSTGRYQKSEDLRSGIRENFIFLNSGITSIPFPALLH